ncbi:hypothetical protein QO001_006258 [Methylobacterium brachiatum]|jgi:hypothetical protein|uniref:Uncharacterized protein n=1 Tax=Methylobacterium brachiatum TaxID=269660 RepID=A0AAJ1TYU1_9HYPH|nr:MULTISPECIES: hypothetical protein [Methylobacterium]MCB4806210.1 hypothetical protein [Methylobacterium brachiatum]MDQ0547299.1 hypothetical protein [Methylobacterium brachiatum]SFV12351.1 hypothetical protein SAMN02799643_05679 [Methylobacterium sp. UNCCL125]
MSGDAAPPPLADASAPTEPVRPVGTWAVAAFLVASIVVVWCLAALVFHTRS